MDPVIEQERKLFQAALARPTPDEREAFLDQECAGNAALRAGVSRLLAAHAVSEKFFTDAAELMREEDRAAIPAGPADTTGEEQAGTVIGRFKILQKVGEGGCGVVYMAEQHEPIRRRVALKIIKLGMDTRAVIARFEQERQALALMDHPNIARVLDAGATQTGRPFFVMELVRGVRITEFCDQNHFDTRQRLELFIQICHAIQHAHQKGIIHRDIKPSNILVTMHDGVPIPKVIDFGIAKATGEDRLTDKTLFTSYGHFVGTPAYMSPEQAEMSGLDVDTRSDIYSLGVLLYELLTGIPPFDQKELLEFGLDQMRRTLQEKEPHRPSTKLNTLHGTELTRTAHRRQTEPPMLRSQLSGDLDWIAMKALEKDRSRRYQTANGLAMDIERHLNNEPVLARPPSQFYRLQKLIRRNRVTFAAGTAVLAALVAGLGTSTWLLFREREAHRQAVAAEQQKIRLLEEADKRQKLTQATVFLSRDKTEDADQLVAGLAVPEANLEYAALFRTLGDWHAVHERWQQASDRFGVLLLVNQPEDWDVATLDYLRLGPVLIEAGNLNGYERFRRSAIARYANTANPLPAERVIKISLLTPADPALLQSLDTLAKRVGNSLEGTNRVEASLAAWRSFSLALLEYRRGDFDQALAWCDRSEAFQKSNRPRQANVNLVRAMAHFQSGARDLARAELRQNTDANQASRRELEVGGGSEGFWFDWVFAAVLAREAGDLIFGHP